MTTARSTNHPAVTLPKPDGDFYQVTECLNDEERDILKQVRTFMETKVAPVITKYWAEDAFPFELIPALRDLKIEGLGYRGLRLQRRQYAPRGVRGNGDGASRLLLRDVLWRPQRLGNGIDLPWRIRGPKAEMASAYGRDSRR